MCVKALMKLVTGILSIVFALLGLIIFVLGMIFQFGLTTIVVNYVKTYTDQLNTYLANANASFNVDQLIVYLPQVTGNLAVALIVMGIVMAAIGIIGLVAVCCENKCVLIVYIIILGLLITAELILVITYYAARSTFVSRAKTYMQTTINEKYSGYNTSNIETMLWNVFHLSLSCCGITNGSDFATASLWTRQVTYSGNSYTGLAYPMTCCKPANYTACLATSVSDVTYSNFNVGCWDKIDNTVQMNLTYAALGTAAVILLQVLILFFAISLCREKRKTDVV